MKEKTFKAISIDKDNKNFLIVKNKLENKHYKKFGYLYELEILNYFSGTDNHKFFEDYQELKQDLKENYNIKITHKDFK
jgi:hypothetical protein